MEEEINQGFVNYSLFKDTIAIIEFGHPMSNSLPGKILQKLAAIIEELGKDKIVSVIILKSHGEKAFCAGASFDELIAIENLDQGKKFFSGFAKVINACRNCPKFIIGRIHGKAVGGGVGIAAAVDYCFASNTAEIKLSELAVGIGPFVVGPAVSRKIGVSAMSELTINATEWRTAAWAKQKGLYTEVFDDIKDMDVAILTLAEKLAKSNPEAMSKLKKIFWQGTENWDKLLLDRAEISGKLVLSSFTISAINQFKKK
jgi:methylglutaconyl-CoA hydratase